MGESSQDETDGTILNVLQLVFLNTVLWIGLTVLFRLLGFTWGWSVGFAYVSAATSTLLICVALDTLTLKRTPGDASFRHGGMAHPLPASATVSDAIEAWDTDRAAEIETSLSRLWSDMQKNRGKSDGTAMQRKWDDSADANVATPKRSVPGGSRQIVQMPISAARLGKTGRSSGQA